MKQIKKVIILGTGGNSIDILDTISEINLKSQNLQLECIGFLDDNKEKLGNDFFGLKVLGSIEDAKNFKDVYFINGIATPDTFWNKENIIKKTDLSIERFITIINPSASISPSAEIGLGVVIFQNTVVSNSVKVGNHVMILPNTIISHDCIVGDYTSITAGVCLSGNVKVGKSCYIGTNSSIKGKINIDDNSLIGMGSIVLSDIPKNCVFVGNPAKLLRKIS